ncbi:MAG: DUF4251 domain-containing protein [Bacteroidales bacterium]|jgi:hypothetical protein|nr:DUF4251 domain-containing protein [Bacteroidales bacterium]
MKRINLFFIFAAVACSSTQDPAKLEATATMIGTQNYAFVAETALPMQGKSIYLTSRYTLEVANDTLTAYLPYFGRAYIAPVSPSEGGIQFESHRFTHQTTKRKNGWDIRIHPSDNRRSYTILLQVDDGGHACLSVNSYDRQAISFTGHLETRNN